MIKCFFAKNTTLFHIKLLFIINAFLKIVRPAVLISTSSPVLGEELLLSSSSSWVEQKVFLKHSKVNSTHCCNCTHCCGARNGNHFPLFSLSTPGKRTKDFCTFPPLNCYFSSLSFPHSISKLPYPCPYCHFKKCPY